MIERRSLITGLIAFVAAPAIVRATSIMPVRSFKSSLAPAELIPGELYDLYVDMGSDLDRVQFWMKRPGESFWRKLQGLSYGEHNGKEA